MKRFLIALILVLLFAPIMSNGAMLIIEEVKTYSDGSKIPDELVNTIRYRYYYADNGTGPFIEGTATIDNLVVSVPAGSPDIPSDSGFGRIVKGKPYFYTVDAELEGLNSGKAVPKQVAKIPVPPGKSSGCSMVN